MTLAKTPRVEQAELGVERTEPTNIHDLGFVARGAIGDGAFPSNSP